MDTNGTYVYDIYDGEVHFTCICGHKKSYKRKKEQLAVLEKRFEKDHIKKCRIVNDKK
jgi:hypothetical protein